MVGDAKVLLATPRTWMNESGIAVSAILHYYKIDVSDLIIVLDDADLEIGRLRLRSQGSSGGHKGLISVSGHTGGDGFARLRVGVGRSDVSDNLVDHILCPFGNTERKAIDKVVEKAVDALVCTVESGTERAMNEFNGVSMLDELIRHHGFDAYLEGLRSRFLANEMKFEHEYSPADRSNPSLHVTLENKHGIAQVSISENGLADVTLVPVAEGAEPIPLHFDLATEETFHNLLARCFRYLRDEMKSLPE